MALLRGIAFLVGGLIAAASCIFADGERSYACDPFSQRLLGVDWHDGGQCEARWGAEGGGGGAECNG